MNIATGVHDSHRIQVGAIAYMPTGWKYEPVPPGWPLTICGGRLSLAQE